MRHLDTAVFTVDTIVLNWSLLIEYVKSTFIYSVRVASWIFIVGATSHIDLLWFYYVKEQLYIIRWRKITKTRLRLEDSVNAETMWYKKTMPGAHEELMIVVIIISRETLKKWDSSTIKNFEPFLNSWRRLMLAFCGMIPFVCFKAHKLINQVSLGLLIFWVVQQAASNVTPDWLHCS